MDLESHRSLRGDGSPIAEEGLLIGNSPLVHIPKRLPVLSLKLLSLVDEFVPDWNDVHATDEDSALIDWNDGKTFILPVAPFLEPRIVREYFESNPAFR